MGVIAGDTAIWLAVDEQAGKRSARPVGAFRDAGRLDQPVGGRAAVSRPFELVLGDRSRAFVDDLDGFAAKLGLVALEVLGPQPPARCSRRLCVVGGRTSRCR